LIRGNPPEENFGICGGKLKGDSGREVWCQPVTGIVFFTDVLLCLMSVSIKKEAQLPKRERASTVALSYGVDILTDDYFV